MHGGRRRRGAPQGVGHEAAGASTAGRARARSAGPTSTRSRRRWASGPWRSSPTARTCRCRSFGRRSSSPRCSHPSPGWIDGFKMADPIIRAYGLGQIPEFPGIPEGIVDIIPVDYRRERDPRGRGAPRPSRRRPAHYNVSSGSRNPLRFYELYECVRAYFEAHPLPGARARRAQGARVDVPRQPHASSGCSARGAADRRGREGRHPHAQVQAMRDAVARVDRDKARVDFVKRYSRSVRHVHRDRGRSTPTIACSRCRTRSRRRIASGSRSTPR